MRSMWRLSLVAVILALPAPAAFGQGKKDKDHIKEVKFKTYDGVTLEGSLYTNTTAKGVVMLLHDFDAKKGGDSSKDYPRFAERLHKEGYSVLTFDFRGFGRSTEVKDSFWKYSHNAALIKHNRAKPPETISYKSFAHGYYIHLLNDIAAAKAFLDRANDRKELNSGNLIVVGAGQGATLGALWVGNEGRRKRDARPPNMQIGYPTLAELGEAESKDVAGCIWLSMAYKVEGKQVGAVLQKVLVESCRIQKVPMVFYYGKKDDSNSKITPFLVNKIKEKKDERPPVGLRGEDTNVAGSKLLDQGVMREIIKGLNKQLEDRGQREMRDRKVQDSAYWYIYPDRKILRPTLVNKKAGSEVAPVDLGHLGIR